MINGVLQELPLTKGVRLAVLQPTSLCNLNCEYCYVPGRRESGLMSDAVLRAAATYVFASAPKQQEFRFLWHAGEPLAAGLPFYRRAFAQIDDLAPPGVSVLHSIQTNGTLISEAWCRLFLEHDVRIGLSIDGPAELHDSNRKTWGGRGSHERVMRGYRLLQEHGIGMGAICVLTRESLAQADAIYDFFMSAGFTGIAFNVDEAEGAHAESSLAEDDFAEVRRAYQQFMRQLWRRWRADKCRMRIREFHQELTCIRDLQADPGFVREPDEVIPFGILTINKDGALSTFGPELASTANKEYDDFVIGNVITDAPGDVCNGEQFRRLTRDVSAGRDHCRRGCPYYALCGGGFQSNRIAEHASLLATETRTCRLHRKALIDVVVEELAAESRHERRPIVVEDVA